MVPPDYVSEIVDLFVTYEDKEAGAGSKPASMRCSKAQESDISSVQQSRSREEDLARCGSRANTRLVLLGNLPVRATIWLEQFADQVASQAGPTALLRLGEGTCSIAVLEGRGGESSTLEPPPEFVGRIGDVVTWLVTHVENVLVVPAEHEAENIEKLLDAHRRILILTGSDDAALVQAYRLVKKFVEEARAKELDPPGASLVVVGKESQYARRVGQRISETATRFLGVELPVEEVLQQIDQIDCNTRMQVSVGPTFGVRELLDLLDRTPRAQLADDVPGEVDGPVPPLHEPDPAPEPVLEPTSPVQEREAIIHEEPEPILNVIEDEELEQLASIFEMSDQVATATEPTAAAEGILALFPALTPLDFECPVDENIALAHDQESARLHLVLSDEQRGALGVARVWACRHESLLRAAIPDLLPFAENGLQIDLLVTNAEAASDLHGTGIRLYLLHRSSTGSVEVIPLNNDKTAGRGF